ncbi:MAG: APC family permease, partial [Proteobacteria bacterium]|nr:APC family permease [Pseudomonadota bacterium]
PVIALLVAVGAMAGASTWIVGPSKGLFASAKDGLIPPFFQKLNSRRIPVNMLLIQGAIVTVYAVVVFLSLDVNNAFWILGALTSQLYLIMYILMFGAAIRLRYLRPDVARSYRVPGGNPGMWLVSGVGVLGSVAAIGLGFLPLAGVRNKVFYVAFLVVGVVVLCGAPLVIYHLRRPEWRAEPDSE